MGIGDVRRTGENRPWTAHPADQTDPSPHRDRRESRRDGESASHGEFVNTLLDNIPANVEHGAHVQNFEVDPPTRTPYRYRTDSWGRELWLDP